MPAKTEAQRRIFCIALSMKRGLTPKSYSPEAAKMAAEMSEETLKEYCGSKPKEGK